MADCDKTCKGIGKAIVGSTFVIGCKPCPRFLESSRKVTQGVQLYKRKFRKLGIKI